MTKLVLIVLAVALLLWLLFGRRRGDASQRKREPRASGAAEEMVSCAQCGVHLPRSDALAARGLHYCSSAHRDQSAPP
jgi:uncharacterized protein